MIILEPVRIAAIAALLASVPLLSASAQTAPKPSPAQPPAATKPETAPMPQTDPAQKPSATPTDKSAKSPAAKANALVGLAVFSSDGTKLGTVHSVTAEPNGKVKEIRIKSGGFLGIGGKLVAVPEGKFTRTGENVQLGMTAEQVSKLPEVKEQS